jgi:hypothetical protein
MSNKIQRKDLIEGMWFILWVVGIIVMFCLLYEVNELKGLMKDASNFRSIEYRISKIE